MSLRSFAASLAFLASSSATAFGADLTILDTNAPLQGLNDPTPVEPVGLNFGTTRGQQAVIALQFAATIWGATLKSPVPIVIDSAFVTPSEDTGLSCSSTAGILGLTGVASYLSGPQFPVSGAAYPVALANALTGADATPGEAHIISRFNASIGTPECLEGQSYYYGLVGNAAFNQHDLVTVFLHEFAHGLGFLSFVDASSGSFGTRPPSVFDFHVWDVIAGMSWQSETDAQREGLADTPGALALQGSALAAAVPDFLDFLPTLSVNVPGLSNQVPFSQATFSGPFFQRTLGVVAAQPLNGCSDFTNAIELAGNVVLIQRSRPDAGVFCRFWDKANRAQDAGAAAVLLFNDVADAPLVTPSSASPGLAIPVAFVTLETGAAILASAAPVTATFGLSSLRGGVDSSGSGVLLYTPEAVVSASSVSHFDTTAAPAVLMEPTIQPTVGRELDLTPAVLSDLGWTVVQGLSVSVAKALEQQIFPNQEATYLVTVVNRRPAPASAVSLDLALPGETSIVSASGACSGTSFPCTLGTIASGAVALTVVTLHVPTGAPTPYVVTATLSAVDSGPNDVLRATSTLATVPPMGCSASGGAPGLLSFGLLALVTSGLRRRGGPPSVTRNRTGPLASKQRT